MTKEELKRTVVGLFVLTPTFSAADYNHNGLVFCLAASLLFWCVYGLVCAKTFK